MIKKLLILSLLLCAVIADHGEESSQDSSKESQDSAQSAENSAHGGHPGSSGTLPFFTSPGSKEEVNRIIANSKKSLSQFNAQFLPNAIDSQTVVNPDKSPYVEKDEMKVQSPNLRSLNVFLPDTRYYVNSQVYPYRAVGTFGGCTATLVYYPGIIVTNAHCLDYFSNGQLNPTTWNKVFYAGFANGNYQGSSTAKALWYNRVQDYAVLKLKVNLDSNLGRYGVYWRTTSFFTVSRFLYMVSYSGDHCSSWFNCQAKRSSGITRGLVNVKSYSGVVVTDIKHDLDSKRGSSGSLMYEWPSGSCCPVMDALNHAEFRNGGEFSLTLGSYVDKNANLARPSVDWKYGFDKVKNY